MTAAYTPSQTPGPYFHLGLVHDRFAAPGAIVLRGVLTDGAGPVADALLEVWYVTADGSAVRRAATGTDGAYRVEVDKPPSCEADGVVNAPHLDVVILAGGLQHHLLTRAYFPDEPDANALDPTLALVPPERRSALVARPTDDGLLFDIRMQGAGETPFFDV